MTMQDPFADFRQQFNEGGGFGFGSFNLPAPGPTSNLDPAFADLLEQQPEIPFQGALQRANLTPNQSEFFRNRRQESFNQFQGILDQQIRAGEVPSARFGDFIGNFDFGREFNQRAPSSQFGRSTASPFQVLKR